MTHAMAHNCQHLLMSYLNQEKRPLYHVLLVPPHFRPVAPPTAWSHGMAWAQHRLQPRYYNKVDSINGPIRNGSAANILKATVEPVTRL